MLKRLPVGIQTFEKIINEDMLYIDKTHLALELIKNEEYVFLSRPRRFGKSLFLDTLKEIFEGNKILFKGLFIEDKYDWDKRYPVISINFSGNRTIESLNKFIHSEIRKHSEKFEITLHLANDIGIDFSSLIQEANKKFNSKIVVLVDEYDKPILDHITNIEEARKSRELLKEFYSHLKTNDKYIRFVMLTGVSKFSKVSLFSGLNNLEDISLTPKYGDICGYTQNDIETSFIDYLEGVDLEKLKSWYNGYNFLGHKVYNPFDILLFIKNDFKYKSYWFETGTPTFLIELIKKNEYFLPNFAVLQLDDEFLNSFDIEKLNLEAIMFQSGYLTITEIVEEFDMLEYKLDYPNLEVKKSLNNYLLDMFVSRSQIAPNKMSILHALNNGKLEDVEISIRRLLSSIAYNNFTKNDIANYEGFYASIIYSYFSALGIELIAEDVTNKGRIDLTLKMNETTYIFEFKVIAEDPLKQIKEKRYFDKYSGNVFIIGIVFNPEKRNMDSFVWEKIE